MSAQRLWRLPNIKLTFGAMPRIGLSHNLHLHSHLNGYEIDAIVVQCWASAGGKSNIFRKCPHFPSHIWAFPCIATCFAQFGRINLAWTYNIPIICKYGKQNPIINSIKDGRAHRVCSVGPRFVQPNEKRYTKTKSGQEMCGRKYSRS